MCIRDRSQNSRIPSNTGPNTGTRTRNHSYGTRPPTTSSTPPPHISNAFPTQDTSGSTWNGFRTGYIVANDRWVMKAATEAAEPLWEDTWLIQQPCSGVRRSSTPVSYTHL